MLTTTAATQIERLAYSIELHNSDSLVVNHDEMDVTIAQLRLFSSVSKVSYQFPMTTCIPIPIALLHIARYGAKYTARVVVETLTGSYSPRGVQVG